MTDVLELCFLKKHVQVIVPIIRNGTLFRPSYQNSFIEGDKMAANLSINDDMEVAEMLDFIAGTNYLLATYSQYLRHGIMDSFGRGIAGLWHFVSYDENNYLYPYDVKKADELMKEFENKVLIKSQGIKCHLRRGDIQSLWNSIEFAVGKAWNDKKIDIEQFKRSYDNINEFHEAIVDEIIKSTTKYIDYN